MILQNNKLLYIACLLSITSWVSANLTTLQYWDPIPFYNAANLNMPPDTPFMYSVKKRMVDEDADRTRRFGLNFSPFVQKAIKAQQTNYLYFGQASSVIGSSGLINSGFQMGDFKGTAFLMGLFLGQDVKGNSIWGDSTKQDTGNVMDITEATVAATLLPKFLKDAVNALNDNINPINTGTDPVTYNNAIIYNNPTTVNDSNLPYVAPSILSQSVLQQDNLFFGAFSMPLEYQKAGFRWEANLDISDCIGFLARGGFCQITQRVLQPLALSQVAPTPQGGTLNTPSLYTGLNTPLNASTSTGNVTGGGIPSSIAQATFNEWVQNNIDDLLDATNGANYDILTFSEGGIEDIQLLFFFRQPFCMHPVDPNKYASIIVTPYFMVGGTVPIAPVRDYSKLYSLPFGNNSHPSLGGVVGLTFDFIDSIEFGFEFGATGFFTKTISGMPCPNHYLQRVIYPYRQDVHYSPGTNAQFAAILNAYEFAHNTSFSFRYNYVIHAQDTITLVTPSKYFFPYLLEDQSAWNSQMFIGALTFELQPSIFLSVAWQGALSQRNAYCSNTILASLNFEF